MELLGDRQRHRDVTGTMKNSGLGEPNKKNKKIKLPVVVKFCPA